jgi:hypothetical protein
LKDALLAIGISLIFALSILALAMIAVADLRTR